ncbi:MAG: ExeM/NucH family extracellular endonuclease, partial [Anaerolineales bacterium]
MRKSKSISIFGTLVGVITLLTIWAFVFGSAPTSAAPADTCPTDLFFSEYIEGSSNNKALEIYNGTGSDITMTDHYSVALYSNGATDPSQTLDLDGVVADGDVYVIANSSADQDILNEADVTSAVTFFNGDDAIALYKDGVLIDVIGQIGTDPGSEWGSGDTTTQEHTLVRKSHIMAGDTDGSDAFDPADEWDGYPQDTFSHLGSHTIDACGAAFSISKSAPNTVSSDEVFTYTLVVNNNTGVTPATTTITDVVPDGVAFIAASDDGGESDGVVTWTVDNFADGETLTRTFLVTATAGHGVDIENADYGVNGGEDWITTTIGAPVTTMVMGECDSIYNIQYPGGPSLCSGETVTVTGIIYAVYGSDFAIAEDEGAWHGIFVDHSGSYTPTVGHEVQVQGTVEENYGFTQIVYVTHTVLMTGTTPYTPSVISTAEAADGEAYEGVLVEVHDVSVSDEDLGYGEWGVDDGSGQVYVDDAGFGGYTYTPTDGDALDLVRGMLNYSFGNYKIAPRGDNDIVEATGSGLLIEKHAPAFTPPGEAFTYTLTVENQTAQTINDLWISDTLPLSLTYASSNPVGTWNEATHTITWTESASIAYGDMLSYTIVVTAPAEMTVVSNTDYMVSSSDWPTPTVGDPVETLIRDCNSIYGIQHTTDSDDGTYPSPCAGENVTVRGIVYAVYGSNYFIAEDEGPWHGIYVYNGGSVSVGDEVEVTGNVVEYYGVTEFSSPSNVEILSSGNALYGPSLVTVDEIPVDDPDISEGYEGVFVEVRDITVTAEANNYYIWTFTDATGKEGKADDWGYRAQPNVGDEYAVLRGPLAYDFSEYKIMPRDADDALEKGIVVIEKDAPATVDLGGIFTYTLTIANQMGFTLDNLVITDVVPANVTFAYALDGGAEENGVVSWDVASLGYMDEVNVRFVVTAAETSGVIINDNYAVSAANYVTPTFGAPVNTAIGELRIYHLQGEGFVSPYEGQEATVEGVVVADFQENDEMRGFFMQDLLGDDNPLTSDGIFVYDPDGEDVDIGYRVRVTGIVDEYQGMTQIKNLSALAVLDTMALVPPATVITLPEEINNEMERYEGMLVTLPHTMTVQQNYFQGRFGQVTLGSGDRMYQPTHLHEPGSDAYWEQTDENARRLLVLDDGSTSQNPDPIPYIGINDTLRAGDVVSSGLIGVLDQGPINTSSPSTKDYRLHPTANVVIDRDNERPATPPDVGGSLQVASFNVLNYFTTFGERGADNQAEFDRQRTKIITALIALDADVVGLMEIENNGYEADGAIYDLVDGLNEEAGAGTYDFIDPGVDQIGDDAIAVGLLYKPASVTPVGAAAILDDSYNSEYREDKNRPALAQTFEENATGERFTAAVNHLKSKGSSCADLDDPDVGDGQGNCNLTRKRAMEIQVEWLATDPTNSGDPDFLIIGDLNAYAMEDPISVAKDAGYTDLLDAADYTYIFDGESGYLDHALANPTISGQVTGAAVWNINADEPSVIDYNTEYKPQDLYAPDAYRSSDHDPVLVGLNLLEQTVLTITKSVVPSADVNIS